MSPDLKVVLVTQDRDWSGFVVGFFTGFSVACFLVAGLLWAAGH